MRRLGHGRAGMAGLVVGIATILGATPAVAETIVDTDRVSLGEQAANSVCYGECGSYAALLEWRLYDDTAPARRRLTGYGPLGAFGTDGARCARIKAIFRAKNGTKLAVRAGSGTNINCIVDGHGGTIFGAISIENHKPVYRANLYSVTIILQTAVAATGPWLKVESVTCRWKTSDCNPI